jgi:phytoene dehydrogenase-like protein
LAWGRLQRRAVAEVRGDGAARLVAGNGLHADFGPGTTLGTFFGWLLTAVGQDVGFPTPRGGAGELTNALVRRLESKGGAVTCNAPVERVLVRRRRAVGVRVAGGEEIGTRRAVLADVSAPRLYLELLPREDVPNRVLRDLRRWQWDWATVKLDWALDAPIQWSAQDARRAPVVHIAEGLDELTVSTGELARGLVPRNPFIVFGQYSMADATRMPAGKETAWAYTRVPQDVPVDSAVVADRMEGRVEALAPGFRDLIRSRRVRGPADLEREDANLAGGAIGGGTAELYQQLVWRPVTGLGRPETPIAALYLASSSAHPGGGVHGGPGAIAARAAINGERAARAALALGAYAVLRSRTSGSRRRERGLASFTISSR